ncbi:MAG: hypothetical protein HYX69_12435 [Planctomycetia bacterium]|nr:hypothetical protein [Planctomycetia bacterium]
MNTRATNNVRLAALAAALGTAILTNPAAAGTGHSGGGGGGGGGGKTSFKTSSPSGVTHRSFSTSNLPTKSFTSSHLSNSTGVGSNFSHLQTPSNKFNKQLQTTIHTANGTTFGGTSSNFKKTNINTPFTPGTSTSSGHGSGHGNGHGNGKNHWFWNWGGFGFFPPIIVNPVVVPSTPVFVPGVNTVVSSPAQPAPAALAAPIAKGIDLALVDVRLIDDGNPAENVGPAFRVSFRNTGAAVVDHEFNVALMAGTDGTPSADLPQALTRVGTFDTKDVMFVDLRLPASAFHMTSGEASATFSKLFVFVDSHQEVNDANRENNLAGLDRTAIQPVK